MTPQERELITKLFDRLAAIENAPRDPDAERAIADGLARAPHAIYPLVQTVLVQDEALKAANARIEELQGGTEEREPERPHGFLDTMRDSLFGRDEGPPRADEAPPRAGSVPSVRPGGSPWANAPGYRDQGYRDAGPPPVGGPGYGPGPGYGAGPGYGPGAAPGGGSFLGTAAATAAGMIGGSLLLGGIRGMLGGHQAGPFAGTFNHLSSGSAGSPWSGGAASGELSHQAGLDDIGRTPSGGDAEQSRAGLLGSSDDQGDDQDSDSDGDDQDNNGDDHDNDGDEGDFGDDTDSGGGSDYA
jgi:uncharacterized protein